MGSSGLLAFSVATRGLEPSTGTPQKLGSAVA